jgi:hypothetical protein
VRVAVPDQIRSKLSRKPSSVADDFALAIPHPRQQPPGCALRPAMSPRFPFRLAIFDFCQQYTGQINGDCPITINRRARNDAFCKMRKTMDSNPRRGRRLALSRVANYEGRGRYRA